jgi:hypothetical protein
MMVGHNLTTNICCLVLWNHGFFMTFHILGIIIPTDYIICFIIFPGVETTNQFRFLPPKAQRDILDKRCLVDSYATQHIGADPP